MLGKSLFHLFALFKPKKAELFTEKRDYSQCFVDFF